MGNHPAGRLGVWGPALVWVAGLLLAGSDGPWMPYVNLVGILLFTGASIRLGQVLPGLDRQEVNPKPAYPGALPRRKPFAQGLRTRHAGNLGVV